MGNIKSSSNTMKHIILILLILVGGLVSAQTNFPKDGDNIKNPHIDKFVGTWIWSNGTESLEFVLKKKNILLPIGNNIRTDVLYGFHKYVKDGKELENSLQYVNTDYKDKKHTLGAMGDVLKPNEIQIGVLPMERKYRTLYANVEYINSRQIRIKNIEIKEVMRINDPLDNSRTLPQDIILTKKRTGLFGR